MANASSSKQLVVPPPMVATYAVTKLGHTGASKRRLLYVRSDVLAFLDASMLAPSAPAAAMHAMGVIKRIIPIPCIHAMISFEGGKQLQLLIRNEHDVFLWKEDASPIEDIVNVLLRLTRLSGNPVPYTREGGQVDPDEMRLEKFPGYTSIARRCELRRSKSKMPQPSGAVTLQSWDAIASPLPFALDPQKMSASLQKTFDGLHIVMMGSVLVHSTTVSPASVVSAGGSVPAQPPVTKVLAFTPTRFIACDEDTGRELVSCCLFSTSKVVLHVKDRVVALHLSDESISTFMFSFPQAAKSAGAHVSDDIGVVSNVIRFILAREGTDLQVDRTEAPAPISSSGSSSALGNSTNLTPATAVPSLGPSVGVAASSGAAQQLSGRVTPPTRPTPSSTAAEVPAAAAPVLSSHAQPNSPGSKSPTSFSGVASPLSPAGGSTADDIASKVPDYRAPVGAVAQHFRSPQVLLARQVVRLTSKGAWEPRVLLVVVGARVIICDERTNVKRSINLDQVSDVSTIVHWEGNALALRVRGEHDLVLRLHPECPSTFTIEQIVLVLQAVLPTLQQPRVDTIETKERLRDIILRERPMKKGSGFVPPAREASMRQQSSLSPASRTQSMAPSDAAATTSAYTNRRMSMAVKQPVENSGTQPSALHEQAAAAPSIAASSSSAPGTFLPAASPSGAENHQTERRLGFAEDERDSNAPQSAPNANVPAASLLYHQQRITDEEQRSRALLEALERDGAIGVLHLAGASERVAMDREELRVAKDKTQSQEENERQRRLHAAEAATLLAQQHALASLEESEGRSRRMIDEGAIDGFDRTVRDERTARLWLQTSLDSQLHSSSNSRSLASIAVPPSTGGERDRSLPSEQPQHLHLESSSSGDNFRGRAPTAPPSPEVAANHRPHGLVVSQHNVQHTSRTERDDPPKAVVSLPQENDRSAEEPHNLSTIMFKKEVQLFTSPRSTPRAVPMSSAARFGAPSTQRSLDLSSMGTPAAHVQSMAATPRLAANSRMIVFPTPSASDGGASRGADGSKNCFFRVKIGVSDAIAVVGNEKFATSVHDRYHSSASASNQTFKEHFTVSQTHVDQRIICVSNDEPRISCGDLSSFLDVLRSGSMRSWVRRDVVMVRSTSFLWVELGVIPFVVAVEKGEKAAHIADRLLEGGTPGNATMPSISSM